MAVNYVTELFPFQTPFAAKTLDTIAATDKGMFVSFFRRRMNSGERRFPMRCSIVVASIHCRSLSFHLLGSICHYLCISSSKQIVIVLQFNDFPRRVENEIRSHFFFTKRSLSPPFFFTRRVFFFLNRSLSKFFLSKFFSYIFPLLL